MEVSSGPSPQEWQATNEVVAPHLKWEGYDKPTWHSHKDLTGCDEYIADFYHLNNDAHGPRDGFEPPRTGSRRLMTLL